MHRQLKDEPIGSNRVPHKKGRRKDRRLREVARHGRTDRRSKLVDRNVVDEIATVDGRSRILVLKHTTNNFGAKTKRQNERQTFRAAYVGKSERRQEQRATRLSDVVKIGQQNGRTEKPRDNCKYAGVDDLAASHHIALEHRLLNARLFLFLVFRNKRFSRGQSKQM